MSGQFIYFNTVMSGQFIGCTTVMSGQFMGCNTVMSGQFMDCNTVMSGQFLRTFRRILLSASSQSNSFTLLGLLQTEYISQMIP
jgi:hypothetical protein